MTNLLIGLGVLLTLVVLFLLFRIQALVSVVKKTDKSRESNGNHWNGIMLFVVFLAGVVAFFWYSGVAKDFYLPEAASEHGKITDNMFWITTYIITAMFLFTNFILFYFSFRYRFRENQKATFFPDNNTLEIVWTIIPAIILTALVISGWRIWTDVTDKAPDDALVIEVKAKQFGWEVRYPGKDNQLGHFDYRLIDATNQFGLDFTDNAAIDDVIPRKIYLPKGRPVLFKIRAVDVLHSVFAPHFRLKMDAVPGMRNEFWFVPDISTEEMRVKTGNPEFNYELACTEVCGRGHFAMRMEIVVYEEDEFNEWYAAEEPWSARNEEYVEEAIAKRRPSTAENVKKIEKAKL